MSAPWWTPADSAECDVLVAELVRSYFVHREVCESCDPTPCELLADWRRHLETCKGCRGDAPLSFPRCDDRYAEFVAHGETCKRCNPCPALREAVAVVVDWRDMRALLSRAEYLRSVAA